VVDIVQLNRETNAFVRTASFNHPYPATKVMFAPPKVEGDLIATSGDYLRIWKVSEDGTEVNLRALYNNNKASPYCAPLTSFDWNLIDPSIIGTCSIDTTCTIWNVETQQYKTQLIAHDREVYDIVFAPHTTDIFASTGADGSVRLFDLRSLEHSTILYENPNGSPLLRLAWDRYDHNYIAAVVAEENTVVILDVRSASVPVATLFGHSHPVNAVSWFPGQARYLATGGDDRQALVWDLTNLPQPIKNPYLSFETDEEVNALQWSTLHPEWVSMVHGKYLQVVRV